MLKFQPEYLREILIDNSDKAIMEYCSICYYELNRVENRKSQLQQKSSSSITQNPEAWFLLRTMSELALILKDKTQSPLLKFKSTKLITYLILMNDHEIFKKFELQLFPLIKSICLYNKSLSIQERGYDFFKKNKYFQMANVEQREKIKLIGAKFVIFCLEVVFTMNKWMPYEDQHFKEFSPYGIAYKELLNDPKINQMLKNVQICEDMVEQNRFSINSTRLVKYNAANRSSISNDPSVSNYSVLPSQLQRQLQEREDALNEYLETINQLKDQKEFLLKQFALEKQKFTEKLTEYETEMGKLHYQLKYLRKKLKKYETNDSQNGSIAKKTEEATEMQLFNSKTESDRSEIMSLKEKMRLLIQENMKLKESNVELESKIKEKESQVNVESRKKMKELNKNNKWLIEAILKSDCQENKEFNYSSLKQNKNHEYVENKLKRSQKSNEVCFLPVQNVKSNGPLIKCKSLELLEPPRSDLKSDNLAIFQPYYSLLNSELKNRLKRCLLKNKEILYKDNCLEIGIRTSQIDEITLLQELVITNIINSNDWAVTALNQRTNSLKNIKIEVINKNNEGEIMLYSEKSIKSKEKNLEKSKDPLKSLEKHLCFEIRRLPKDQQEKFELQIEINNINFTQGIFARVYYEHESINGKYMSVKRSSEIQESMNIGLILPVFKIKLAQLQPKISSPLQMLKSGSASFGSSKHQSTLIKLFYLNQKVLESLQKLTKYFGQQYVHTPNHNQKVSPKFQSQLSSSRNEERYEVSIKLKFMDKFFTISFGYVTENHPSKSENFHNRENIYISKQKKPSEIEDNSVCKKLVKMIINYDKTTPFNLADYLASQFVFILSIN